jgi:hypothetical protein
MKLYATTTSERASKGQGGNKYLSIEIKTDKTILTACFIEIVEQDENNILLNITANGELRNGVRYIIPKELKGKSQKGELYLKASDKTDGSSYFPDN